MPPVTRWMVRAGMLYLVAALLLGIAVQLPQAARIPALAVVWPTYLHLLVVGWLSQLIFGVAYWMFPRYSATRPRGSEALGWATFGLLNAGLILRAVAEPWLALSGRGDGVLVAAAVLQAAAALAFAANTWPRVRER